MRKKNNDNRKAVTCYYDDESSITESNDSKDKINFKVNPKTIISKYETLIDSEKKGYDIEIC